MSSKLTSIPDLLVLDAMATSPFYIRAIQIYVFQNALL